MFDVILTLIPFIGVAIASYTDIRTREVNDAIPLTMVGSTLLLRGAISIATSSPTLIFESLIAGISYLLFSILMVSIGAWGEGDGTMFTAIGFSLGITPLVLPNPNALLFPNAPWVLPITYILNLFLILTVYDFGYMGILLVKSKDNRVILNQSMEIRKIELIIGIVLTILSVGLWYILSSIQIKGIFLLIVPLVIWGILLGRKTSRIFEEKILWRKVKYSNLRRGDKLIDPVNVDGELIIPNRIQGLTQTDIEKLKQTQMKQNIPENFRVQQGIPGLPAFFIALVFSLFYGDLLLLIAIVLSG